MSQEKHYEMLWDCQFCGSKKNLGKTHRFCPNCGAPQDPKARYFPADDEKVAVEDHQFVGKDLICGSCGALNAAVANNCGNCGASLENAEQASTIEGSEWMGKSDSKKFETSRDVAQEKFEADMIAAGVKKPDRKTGAKKSGGAGRFIGIGLALLVLVCGGLFFLFSRTEEQTVVASDHSWEREIKIEEYRSVRDGDWRDQVPSGAYSLSCSQRERDTRRIPDGEDCRTVRRDNGDGTFTEREECTTRYREEPIMDSYCDYSIDRWVYSRSVTTSATGFSRSPFWGDINLQCSGQNRLGCEREEDRDERYVVTFTANGEAYDCTFPQSEWEQIRPESTWTMEVRQFVGGAVCDSLQPR